MNKALAVCVIVVLWLILFLAEQRALQAWPWMIIASAVFAMISLGFVFLGFCARQGSGYLFFLVAIVSLFLSTVFMFVGHEEYKDFIDRVRVEKEIQYKIDVLRFGRR